MFFWWDPNLPTSFFFFSLSSSLHETSLTSTMGKYMKKPKISTSSDVALMKQPQHHSSHGVRTRAKTNNLINSDDASCFSYLQLRSRRLPKIFAAGKSPAPAPAAEEKSRGECCGGNPKIENSKGRESDEVESVDICMESSFGENVSEVEEKDRYYVYICFFLNPF